MENEAYLHFPTLLDWIEHVAAFAGFAAIGWFARGWFNRNG
jgi:hypothetical protein